MGDTLRSILSQTHAPREVVVVDDGSSDGTAAAARAAGGARVTVIRTDNRGVAAARNLGAARTTAPLLAFCDADDLWTPGKLAAEIAALGRRPGAAVAYSWVDYVDPTGTRLGSAPRVRHEGDVLRDLLVRYFLESGSAGLVRRPAFEAVGGFDERLRFADWDLFLRLAEQHPFVLAPVVGVLYRLAPGSMSTDLRTMRRDLQVVVGSAFARAPEDLRHLRPRALATIRRITAWKGLDARPGRDGAVAALRELARSLLLDPGHAVREPRATLHLSAAVGARLLLPGPTVGRLGRLVRPVVAPAVAAAPATIREDPAVGTLRDA